MKTLLILTFLLTALPTFARLGETRAECEARYGKPLGTTVTNGNPFYLKGGLEITVIFWRDKAVALFFAKLKTGTKETDLPLSYPEDCEPLSEAEMDVLLQANDGASKWKQLGDNDDNDYEDITWNRSDGKGYAQYADRCLEIRDQPGLDEWLKEKEAKKIEPFKDFPRLYETKAEFEKRCGKPVKTLEDGRLVYRKAGLKITTTFWNDKAGKLMIESEKLVTDPFSETPDTHFPEPLLIPVRDAVLQASADNSTWELDDDDDRESIYWSRADKKAYAIYYLDKSFLSITDEQFFDYQSELTAKQADEKFKDFGAFGQTKAGCEKLYGKPVTKPGDDPIGYHKAGIAIFITFWKERAAKLVFLKVDEDDIEAAANAANRESILGGECDAILKANSDGSKWTESEDSGDDKTTWVRADLQAIAVYEDDKKTLTIHAHDYVKHLQKDLNDKDAKKLDGF